MCFSIHQYLRVCTIFLYSFNILLYILYRTTCTTDLHWKQETMRNNDVDDDDNSNNTHPNPFCFTLLRTTIRMLLHYIYYTDLISRMIEHYYSENVYLLLYPVLLLLLLVFMNTVLIHFSSLFVILFLFHGHIHT